MTKIIIEVSTDGVVTVQTVDRLLSGSDDMLSVKMSNEAAIESLKKDGWEEVKDNNHKYEPQGDWTGRPKDESVLPEKNVLHSIFCQHMKTQKDMVKKVVNTPTISFNLPFAKPGVKFKKGDRVKHEINGNGTVVDTCNDIIVVDYDSGFTSEIKNVLATLLKEKTIPFDLDRWKKGDFKNVVTRDGREVSKLTDFGPDVMKPLVGKLSNCGFTTSWNYNGFNNIMPFDGSDLMLLIETPAT